MHAKIISALAVLGVAVHAQGVVDNARVAKSLVDEAVPLDGNYKITNKKTGATITYVHNDQANFLPSLDTIAEILKSLGDGSGLGAGDTLELKPSFRGDGSTRIRYVPDNKVISAQWEEDIGRDEYGVAYECAYGDEPECHTDSLEPYKQFWAAIPVDDSYLDDGSSSASEKTKAVAKVAVKTDDSEKTDSSDDSDSTDGSGCTKAGDWLYRNAKDADSDWYVKHPECKGLAVAPVCTKDATWLAQHSEYVKDHPECKKVLNKAGMMRRSHKSIASSLKKRASPDSGVFYFVAMDHIEDMTTRALAGEAITAFADAQAVKMVDFDRSDESQMWVIEKQD
ncbi:hypothetical protein BT69DRAFT_1340859 [Atractiella rhizophila]|jgi:hypothetical protein|nr:hypothetical protein BT69DRAFT_1340881 [Atractiella rhizophila]KAH8915832.1 hypothetical protein BT69DRAFT_1340859 [Atractiella rhizophila]